MEYELSEDSDDTLIHHHEAGRGSTTKKYVIARTIFANLNHVLLVYYVGVMSGAIIYMQKDLKITGHSKKFLLGF
ncbi:hypothetical protein SLA2020_045710 [Shorea laevis]